MKKIICSIALSLSVLSFWPYTASGVNCSSSAIQAAINNAKDGDIIMIDVGTCNWTADVTMPNTKGLKLIGAGESSTIINLNGHVLNLRTSSARQPVRISGMRFNKTESATDAINITGSAKNWRIDHNYFNGNYREYIIRVGFDSETDSYTYGVIDSNTFVNYFTAIFIQWNRGSTIDAIADGDWIWSQPAQRGTAQAVYVENNTFMATTNNEQAIDGRWGMKYVFRYNTIQNPWITTHSGCTNQGREPVWVEIYKNTLSDNGNPYGGEEIWLRSVSGIIWANTSTQTMTQYDIAIDHERSYTTCSGPYGARCDGSAGFDENAGLHGYKCLGQPGWGQPQATNMSSNTFSGVFAWGNTNGGSPVNLAITNNFPYTSEHLAFGRELFNAANMTIGLIENRPGTCSAGPSNRSVYVSTNENSLGATLYVCTAPNTWTKHWEPYAYPHPLRLGGGGGTGIPLKPGLRLISPRP